MIRGKFQRRTVQCHTCHSKRISYEEKETDVSLAVRLVEGAARNDFDTALLISGDAEFVPAIQSARRLKPDLRIVVVFPPKRISDALRRQLTRVSCSARAGSPTTSCLQPSSAREPTCPAPDTGSNQLVPQTVVIGSTAEVDRKGRRTPGPNLSELRCRGPRDGP